MERGVLFSMLIYYGFVMKWIIAALSLVSAQTMALTLTTEDYPPFNFAKDGSVTGFCTDVMSEVLKRTGIKGSIALYPWARAYKMAQVDKDTCVYSATRTEAREKLFKWVGPLASDSWVLYAKSESPISAKSLDDVRGYRIAGYLGDAKSNFLKENGFNIYEVLKDEQIIKNLEAGRVDLWAASSRVGLWLAKASGVKIKPVLSFKEVQLYAACNLDMPDADINKMNHAVKAIQADGTLDKFMKVYR